MSNITQRTTADMKSIVVALMVTLINGKDEHDQAVTTSAVRISHTSKTNSTLITTYPRFEYPKNFMKVIHETCVLVHHITGVRPDIVVKFGKKEIPLSLGIVKNQMVNLNRLYSPMEKFFGVGYDSLAMQILLRGTQADTFEIRTSMFKVLSNDVNVSTMFEMSGMTLKYTFIKVYDYWRIDILSLDETFMPRKVVELTLAGLWTRVTVGRVAMKVGKVEVKGNYVNKKSR